MALLSFLHPGKLSPRWQYDVSGVVWRLFPTGSGYLVGEERELAGKTASFFCLDQMTGSVRWEKVTFEERWWIGIEAVHGTTILLHGFATPDLPEHKSIIAIDLLSGAMLWSNADAKYLGVGGEFVYAALDSLERRRVIELDSRTGAVRRAGDAVEILKNVNASAMPPVKDSPGFPVAMDYAAATSTYSAVRQYCRGKNIIGAVEILDHDNHVLIFNCHEKVDARNPSDAALRNVLQVVDRKSGEILFGDVLDSSAAAFVPDSFFVQHNMLYYIKDRHRLTAVPLADSV